MSEDKSLEDMLEEFEGDKLESLATKMQNMTPDQFARFVRPIETEYACVLRQRF